MEFSGFSSATILRPTYGDTLALLCTQSLNIVPNFVLQVIPWVDTYTAVAKVCS